jgi:cell division protein FtsB
MARRPAAHRRVHVLRWLGAAVVLAIAIAYVQPIRAYFDAKEEVATRTAERSALVREQAKLRHELALSETQSFLEREARRLGLVRPGEQLFIVSGAGEPAEDGRLP